MTPMSGDQRRRVLLAIAELLATNPEGPTAAQIAGALGWKAGPAEVRKRLRHFSPLMQFTHGIPRRALITAAGAEFLKEAP